ncbi:MAG: ATP-dependent RecD-like DNA helicase [Candidatus Izemoplasma sp.]|nr:ATP-dependent RecD-like DNA helicase [Candidatus Izemoplasma sp.]
MKYIQGIVKAIIFHSEQNAFTIIKIDVTKTSKPMDLITQSQGDYLTVTGYFLKPMRGEEIRFFGKFKNHPKYGMQYVASQYEKIEETSIPGLIEYLSSDLFPGVGIKTATHVVNTLGKDAIKKIIDDKEVLNKVPKLSDKITDVIYDGLVENKAAEHTLIKLYSYGIGPKMAMKIFHHYGEKTIAIIEQNPYQLMMDIEGVGFERADKIAKELGFEDDHPLRVKAMILYLYQYMGTNYGHTYLSRQQLLEFLETSLNKSHVVIETPVIDTYIDELIDDNVFDEHDEEISLKQIYYAREHVVNTVVKLCEETESQYSSSDIDDTIDLFEQVHDMTYTEEQRQAIHDAMTNHLFILTGGPGTGKTTIIQGIVFVYSKLNDIPILYNNPLFEIKLIAPTGRASKRMNDTTKVYAETIHRFLGYGYDGKFAHDKDNLVDAKVIIVDEASMIDIYLAAQLFQSIPKDTKVILVGDKDQLPSVGPGQVLNDLLNVNEIPSLALTRIFRQASNSHIIDLAYHINQGELPSDLMQVYDDRMFVKEHAHSFQSRLVKSLEYLMNQGYDLIDDIQILIPMYRGTTGIDAVNNLVQKTFNKGKGHTVEHGDRTFKTGDKVIQLSNQVEDNIMNGDQGTVIGVTKESTVIVSFDGNEVTYTKGDLIHLKHAYAMSIHKSQGSEYKVVVLPIFKNYSIMLKKKLIYTAITRAKEKLVIMGDESALRYGVEHIENTRQSKLQEAITARLNHRPETRVKVESNNSIIDDPDIPFDTLGEKLNGLSPYDFLKD